MDEKETLMGIDMATKKTGIAIIHNGKLQKYKLIDYSPIKDTEERITKMTNEICRLINVTHVSSVWIEDNYSSVNIRVSKILTLILGGVRHYCVNNGVKFHAVLPTQWRKYFKMNNGHPKRDELKRRSVEFVKTHFKLDVNDDVSDAICIALFGLHSKKEEKSK